MVREIGDFCCQNSNCETYGKKNAGNLGISEKSNKNGLRIFRCNKCKKRFVETKGTPYYRGQLPHDTINKIAEMTKEGVGVRKIGRLLNIDKNAVMRYQKIFGEHALKAHNELVSFSPSD